MMAFNGLNACDYRRWPMMAFDSWIDVGLEWFLTNVFDAGQFKNCIHLAVLVMT